MRMRVLMGGRECILAATVCLLAEIALYVIIIFFNPAGELYIGIKTLALNGIVCTFFIIILVVNGCARLFAASKQAGIVTKLLLVLFWWIPVFNLVLLKKIYKAAVKEYVFVSKKTELNKSRAAEEVCKTKYPLLLVHGIFWRDWQAFNYWGRIPKELITNGATIFYGNNKSSASVAESGSELADCIQKIVSETSCEKLNIIAHSKGGLDSRYAISGMGMGKYVASLTTISAPHYGCNSVRKLVDMIPEKLLHVVDKKYETLYSILGDNDPDFLSGLMGLTDKECEELNRILPDDQEVYYQSVCSKMTSSKGAVFPLNLGYTMIKWNEGDNDGLVAVDSMAWGNFLGVVTPRGKQGISHGDMIDLTRMDIEGFDVCEFYVDLVSKLVERGF